MPFDASYAARPVLDCVPAARPPGPATVPGGWGCEHTAVGTGPGICPLSQVLWPCCQHARVFLNDLSFGVSVTVDVPVYCVTLLVGVRVTMDIPV